MITPLLTRTQAAAILGISTKTLDSIVARWEIAVSRYCGCVMFTQRAVQDYIDSHTIKATSASASTSRRSTASRGVPLHPGTY